MMSIIIDIEKHIILKEGNEIELPKKEFELFQLLSSIPGKVFSRKQIFNIVWGEESSSNERTVDVHIVNLRRKLGNHLIKTIKGVGYKITDEDTQLIGV